MNSRQKIEALSAALKAGQELPNLWNIQSKPLNNLNSSSGDNLTPNRAFKLQAEHSDLNNLKRGGVPRQELYTDETLKKAMSWGVQEWLVQVSFGIMAFTRLRLPLTGSITCRKGTLNLSTDQSTPSGASCLTRKCRSFEGTHLLVDFLTQTGIRTINSRLIRPQSQTVILIP